MQTKLILAAFSLLPAGFLLADSVSLRSLDVPATVAPTLYDNVTIQSVDSGKITFTTSGGNTVTKDFATVVDMNLGDEPDFDQAQIDYNANRMDKAVDGYDATLRKTDKGWLKTWCEARMTDAANKSGRFDKAVQGYVALVMSDPTIAAKHQPDVPANGSSYLDAAAQTVSTAVDGSSVTPDQQSALLSFLLEIQRARKDDAAVADIANKLAKNGVSAGGVDSGLAVAAIADAKLTEARNDLQNQKYDDAIGAIQGNKQIFVDPSRQADALFIVAQGREGLANAGTDQSAWKDAALAYLRVAADFQGTAGKPHVADSLLKAGTILEKLNSPGKALGIYESIVADASFANTPAAQSARQQIERLKAAGTKEN